MRDAEWGKRQDAKVAKSAKGRRRNLCFVTVIFFFASFAPWRLINLVYREVAKDAKKREIEARCIFAIAGVLAV